MTFWKQTKYFTRLEISAGAKLVNNLVDGYLKPSLCMPPTVFS